MGVVKSDENECKQCHGTAGEGYNSMPCPGHMGSIELKPDQYIFHPLMVDKLALILNMFCTKCYTLKFRSLYNNMSDIE